MHVPTASSGLISIASCEWNSKGKSTRVPVLQWSSSWILWHLSFGTDGSIPWEEGGMPVVLEKGDTNFLTHPTLVIGWSIECGVG